MSHLDSLFDVQVPPIPTVTAGDGEELDGSLSSISQRSFETARKLSNSTNANGPTAVVETPKSDLFTTVPVTAIMQSSIHDSQPVPPPYSNDPTFISDSSGSLASLSSRRGSSPPFPSSPHSTGLDPETIRQALLRELEDAKEENRSFYISSARQMIIMQEKIDTLTRENIKLLTALASNNSQG